MSKANGFLKLKLKIDNSYDDRSNVFVIIIFSLYVDLEAFFSCGGLSQLQVTCCFLLRLPGLLLVVPYCLDAGDNNAQGHDPA